MASETKQQVPPYTTYTSFVNLINDLRESGMPTHIMRSVVKGSNSGKATMIASLKAMGLIKDDASPTPLFSKLVEQKDKDSYRANLNELLKGTYAFLFDGSLDLANTTSEKVAEKFKEAGANGSTASKGVGFFLALAKEAGIVVHSRVKAPAPTRNGGRVKAKKSASALEDRDDNQDDETGAFEAPEGMIRIPIALHDMEDGVILLPAGLNKKQWAYAKKMAAFILENYHTDFDNEGDE